MSLFRIVIDVEALNGATAGEITARLDEFLAARDLWKGVSVGDLTALGDISPRQLVNDWLSSLDAKLLEGQALDLMGGFGGAASTGEAFIAALRQDAATLP